MKLPPILLFVMAYGSFCIGMAFGCFIPWRKR